MIDNILNLVRNYGVKFLEGTGYTLLFSFITVFFGLILGALVCMVKRSKFIAVRFIAGVYSDRANAESWINELKNRGIESFLLPEKI